MFTCFLCFFVSLRVNYVLSRIKQKIACIQLTGLCIKIYQLHAEFTAFWLDANSDMKLRVFQK